MTIQFWTILSTDGDVLCPCITTPSYGSHPKDNGWPWDAETQRATRIDAAIDPACQRWDGTAWIADLEVLRSRRWAQAKARRDIAEWGGCATPLGIVDTDPDSQRKVGGAVQMAMIAQSLGQSFVLDWTMRDNASVAHDAPAMILMGVAVGQHVAACHEIGLTKRAAIDAAGDAAAIAAVDIEGGWPNGGAIT